MHIFQFSLSYLHTKKLTTTISTSSRDDDTTYTSSIGSLDTNHPSHGKASRSVVIP